MWRTGRGADEEEFLALRRLEVPHGDRFDGRGFAEVDPRAGVGEDGFAVEELADSDRVVDGVEGTYYSSKGLQRGEGVDGADGGDVVPDCGEGGRMEDAEGVEVGY